MKARPALISHVLGVDEATGAYVFRHALVQEAIYDDLLPVQRGPLHAAYARALERRIERRGDGSGASSDSVVERGQLAYHWYAAHDLGQALLRDRRHEGASLRRRAARRRTARPLPGPG